MSYKEMLIEALRLGLQHDTYEEYGSTFCEPNCEACALEAKAYEKLKEDESCPAE